MKIYKITILLLLLALISVSCQNKSIEQVPPTIQVVTAIPTSEIIPNTETSPAGTAEIPLPTTSPRAIESTIQK